MPISVLNQRRGNRIIHISKNVEPKHQDHTLCGLQMKGKRWTVVAQQANCRYCLEGGSDGNT